ncbi:MAG: serine protease [Nocardioidaceae bacterium]|nr:serine protease [Nocardioidaceae bacterium]MCL2613486.1 serine protease [Nocardioidaceae bacterium]
MLLAVLSALAVVLAGPAAHAAPPAAGPVEPAPTVGPLFFPSVGGLSTLLHLPHFCSASVLDSSTRDLLVTAAHCVYGTGLTMEFAPGFHDGIAPYGVWEVRRAYVTTAWRAHQDPADDVAVLEVAPRAGRRLEDVVGAGEPVGTPAASAPVTVTGYPMGVDGSTVGCTTGLYLTGGYPSIDCTGFADGTSGGPWIQAGRLVGVVGGKEQGGCADSEYSAPIAGRLPGLVARAEAGRPSDLVPIGFLANACL